MPERHAVAWAYSSFDFAETASSVPPGLPPDGRDLSDGLAFVARVSAPHKPDDTQYGCTPEAWHLSDLHSIFLFFVTASLRDVISR